MGYCNDKLFKELLEKMSFLLDAPVSFYNSDFSYNNIWAGHSRELCTQINRFCKGNCTECDKKALNRAKTEISFYYHCHFGLIEMIFKTTLYDKDFGYVLIGPFREKKNNDEVMERIKQFCLEHGVDEKEMLSAYRKLPYFNEEKYAAVKDIIYYLFEYAKKQNIIYLKDNLFESDIKDCIEETLNKDLSVEMLCERFHLTHKQLSKIISDSTGMTPKKYISERRLDRAIKLINNTSKPLPTIAEEIGIPDYNYFIKVFKKRYSHPPTYYRKNR